LNQKLLKVDQGSKDSCHNPVRIKTWATKSARWVGVQVPMTSSKNGTTYPNYDVTNKKIQNFSIFKTSKLQDFPHL